VALPGSLPLFPLHTVLFPGRPLPLHIFEPRYRLMIGRCLERSTPFGVALIRAGREVGAAAEPYAVGTTASIVEHARLPDGRLHLVAVGVGRFRLCELLPGEPYLQGRVEEVVDEPVEPEAPALAGRFAAALGAYLGREGAASGAPALPTDPTELSFAAPAALPLELTEQQKLLELTSVSARFRWLMGALDRELRLRGTVGETRPAHPHALGRLSPN
jgi:Lon protease-like protein